MNRFIFSVATLFGISLNTATAVPPGFVEGEVFGAGNNISFQATDHVQCQLPVNIRLDEEDTLGDASNNRVSRSGFNILVEGNHAGYVAIERTQLNDLKSVLFELSEVNKQQDRAALIFQTLRKALRLKYAADSNAPQFLLFEVGLSEAWARDALEAVTAQRGARLFTSVRYPSGHPYWQPEFMRLYSTRLKVRNT